jgi:hypothetical protein
MAKQDQQVLMAQKSQLERELARARITDFKDASVDQVASAAWSRSGGRTAPPRATRSSASGTAIRTATSSPTRPRSGPPSLEARAGETIRVKMGATEDAYSIVSIARYAS